MLRGGHSLSNPSVVQTLTPIGSGDHGSVVPHLAVHAVAQDIGGHLGTAADQPERRREAVCSAGRLQ